LNSGNRAGRATPIPAKGLALDHGDFPSTTLTMALGLPQLLAGMPAGLSGIRRFER
jgi:hypothetical protein